MGQGADDLDLVGGEELRQIPMRSRLGDGEVTSVDHVPPERPTLLDEPAEVRVELRRSPGDVDHGDVRRRERAQAELERLSVHRLPAVRTRVHVAMLAGLVAELPHVHLEDLDLRRSQGIKPRLGQGILELERHGQTLEDPALVHGRRQRVPSRREGREPCDRRWSQRAHIEIFLAWFRICTPWTSEAPPRIAAETCTASVICSRSAPFSRQSLL